jgi:uncharacterized protein YkwD
MKKKLLLILVMTMLTASACGAPNAAEPTSPVVTSPPVQTAAPTEIPPTATETQAVEIVPTFTVDIPIPTNAPDCANRAAFVADVTFPDNTSIASSTAFTKTWRIQNNGTCVWGPDYLLIHYSEERMAAPASVPLSVTLPGQTADVTVELTSPSAVGSHRANFVINTPAGTIMKIDNDSRLWVVVNVTGVAGSSATAAPTAGTVSIPPTASTGSGAGFANVTCAFSTDAAKVTEAITALNAYRAQNGLPAFPINQQLTLAATAHANDMACNNFFVHTGSNGSNPTTRVAASGYKASSVTENVYGSYPPLSGQGAIDWFKNDRTDIRHNQNLLSTVYTEIGVAYSFFNNYGYYVIVFAKP